MNQRHYSWSCKHSNLLICIRSGAIIASKTIHVHSTATICQSVQGTKHPHPSVTAPKYQPTFGVQRDNPLHVNIQYMLCKKHSVRIHVERLKPKNTDSRNGLKMHQLDRRRGSGKFLGLIARSITLASKLNCVREMAHLPQRQGSLERRKWEF